MNLPGLLVEYLITGALALIWSAYVITITSKVAPRLDQISAAEISALVPLAYVLGMFVDYIGKLLTDRWTIDDGKETMHKSEIFARSAEVGKQYEMRKSRDRIARGVLANIVFLGIVGAAVLARQAPRDLYWWLPLFAALALLSFTIWRRFYKLTRRYKLRATDVLLRIRDESQSRVPPATNA